MRGSSNFPSTKEAIKGLNKFNDSGVTMEIKEMFKKSLEESKKRIINKMEEIAQFSLVSGMPYTKENIKKHNKEMEILFQKSAEYQKGL